jgi:hypothetical protein
MQHLINRFSRLLIIITILIGIKTADNIVQAQNNTGYRAVHSAAVTGPRQMKVDVFGKK